MSQKSPETFSPLPRHSKLQDDEEDDDGDLRLQTSTSTSSPCASVSRQLRSIFDTHFFLIFVVLAILLAYAAPGVGKSGGVLISQYTISYGATIGIFLLTGFSLKSSEFANAFMSLGFNCYIQSFCYFAIPAMTYPVVLLLKSTFVDDALSEGLLVMACLPTTVNMCVILTTSANGNVSMAVLNASIGNLLGILITPLLLLFLLNVHSSISFLEVIIKLSVKVVVPLAIGQFFQYLHISSLDNFFKEHKKLFKRAQEILLVIIIYASFCNTFADEIHIGAVDIVIVSCVIVGLQLVFMATSWFTMKIPFFNLSLSKRIAGLFCSTQKSVAMGIPLITSIFEEESASTLSMYTLPILIYHPLQLLVGTMLAPSLREMVAAESQILPTRGYKSPEETEVRESLATEEPENDKEIKDEKAEVEIAIFSSPISNHQTHSVPSETPELKVGDNWTGDGTDLW